MKPLFGVAAMLTLFSPQAASADAWSLPRSTVEEIVSPDGHRYRLLLAWPEGEAPAAGWPVLWLLDGEDNFATAVITARRLMRASTRSGLEAGIIAAIDSGPLERRIYDYTPAVKGYTIPRGMPASGQTLGGSKAFLDLIDGPMMARVNSKWRIDPDRQTLAGHSFGGLLALQAMFAGRKFDGIVAVSPSLWFGEGYASAAERSAPKDRHARLLIANDPGEGGPDNAAGAAAEALAQRWNLRGNYAKYIALPGLGHGSTMLSAMTSTITFAFKKEPQ